MLGCRLYRKAQVPTALKMMQRGRLSVHTILEAKEVAQERTSVNNSVALSIFNNLCQMWECELT